MYFLSRYVIDIYKVRIRSWKFMKIDIKKMGNFAKYVEITLLDLLSQIFEKSFL